MKSGLYKHGLFALAALCSIAAKAEVASVVSLDGPPQLYLGNYDIGELGYSAQEFLIAGTARSYRPNNAAGEVVDGDTAPYKTRIVVARPKDPLQFNGTVVVEWLNVSGGLDVPVDWTTVHRELVREGYAYVAVSAQKVGVEGGASVGGAPSRPLKSLNPARYGSLSHPGDAYAFDMFSDVARLIGSKPSLLLGDLKPEALIGAGESQSAMYLTTYINAVDPRVRLYDGFLVHSRSAAAGPLDGSSLFDKSSEEIGATRLRSDLRVPVFQVITETDLMGLLNSKGFTEVRQPDGPNLRSWEIAGTAHADNYLFSVGAIDTGKLPHADLARAWAPINSLREVKLPHAMNNGPQHHYVTQAALHHLNTWVRSGALPPTSQTMELSGNAPSGFVTDEHGIARGGVRTPWVDVPISTLSGLGGVDPAPLVGTSKAFDGPTLARLYPGGKSDYLAKFTRSLDASITAGFILPADRDEILGIAQNSYPGEDAQ